MSSPTKDSPASAADTSSRRRSSNGSSGLFGNLMAQKRSSDNAAYSARRASLEDQGAKQGIFGTMWNNAVRGVGPTSPK